MPNVQLRNTLLLMGASFIWGTAFVAQSVGADHMGPYSFLAGRSWLACVFLLGLMAVLRKAGKTNSAAEPGFWQNRKVLVKGGICCGIALFAASAAQQMGIGTTSTAKAGFMTALYVVLVPVFGVFFGRRPGVKLWCCVAASVVGLYLLCLAGHDSLTLTGGEWQLLGCAFLFATQILLVDHFSPKLDGIQLSFVQFLTVAVISTVFMLIRAVPPGGGGHRLLRHHVQRRGLHTANCGPESAGPHHCQFGYVPGECVQRLGRLADFGRDAFHHRAVRLRPDVCRHRSQPAAGQKESLSKGPFCERAPAKRVG